MKIVVQRVDSASVTIEDKLMGEIKRGLLLFVGFGVGDKAEELEPIANKIANLRIFPDEKGDFQFSLLNTGGGVLVVPNFTLCGDTSRGRRPDFTHALSSAAAGHMFSEFVDALKRTGIKNIVAGCFGAHMRVASENDGPVTLLIGN